MAAVLFGTHDRNAPHDAPAGLVAVEQERGQALARIVAGLRDQDEVLRDLRAGDEPLAAVNDPAVAVARRASCAIIAGSEPPPGCGSVIANAERTRPSTIGAQPARLLRRRGDLSRARVMLPSSGAAQLKHTGPKIESFIAS